MNRGGAYATRVIASAPGSWQPRQRASYCVRRSHHDRVAGVGSGPALDESLRGGGGAAAAVADGLQLVDELGVGEQLGHDAEGKASEVLVEPGDDDADAAVGEVERRPDDAGVEELHLVDPDHIVPGRPADELRHTVDRDGAHAHAGVRRPRRWRRNGRRCAA